MSDEDVKASGSQYKTGTFPSLAAWRAHAMRQASSFAQIGAARDDNGMLGVQIVARLGRELNAEAVVAMQHSVRSESLPNTIHAHRTLAEAVHEVALATDKRSINFINR